MKGRLRVAPGTLLELDSLVLDAIALPVPPEPSQPQGVAGAVDWRLGGRIAQLLASGRVRPGEHLLMPGGPRVGAERVLVCGADGRVAALEALSGAGARRVGLAPVAGRPALEEARAWLRALAEGPARFEEVVLLTADAAPTGPVGPALRALAQAAGLEVEGAGA